MGYPFQNSNLDIVSFFHYSYLSGPINCPKRLGNYNECHGRTSFSFKNLKWGTKGITIFYITSPPSFQGHYPETFPTGWTPFWSRHIIKKIFTTSAMLLSYVYVTQGMVQPSQKYGLLKVCVILKNTWPFVCCLAIIAHGTTIFCHKHGNPSVNLLASHAT